jgi:hypothetical protein
MALDTPEVGSYGPGHTRGRIGWLWIHQGWDRMALDTPEVRSDGSGHTRGGIG